MYSGFAGHIMPLKFSLSLPETVMLHLKLLQIIHNLNDRGMVKHDILGCCVTSLGECTMEMLQPLFNMRIHNWELCNMLKALTPLHKSRIRFSPALFGILMFVSVFKTLRAHLGEIQKAVLQRKDVNLK